MARPPKIGLDYFPFETSLPMDDKIRNVRALFGLQGYAIYTLLLCKIYRDKGYYCNWGEDEARLFIHDLKSEIDPATAKQIINELFNRGLLNKEIFEKCGILTSGGIQHRYLDICKQIKRPVTIDPRYDCRNQQQQPVTPTLPFEITQQKACTKTEKEQQLRALTTENPDWLRETSALMNLTPVRVKNFCENFITTKALTGELLKYDCPSLTRFMLTDLQNQKPITINQPPAKKYLE